MAKWDSDTDVKGRGTGASPVRARSSLPDRWLRLLEDCPSFIRHIMEINLLLEFSDRDQLRSWLEENHRTHKECWVACYRGKEPRKDALPYLAIVEEALCFGWIDSTNKRLPDGRLAQRLSPRRKNSHWTELNKERCRDLERRGLMTEAGLAELSKA